jgi:hypothetical protein
MLKIDGKQVTRRGSCGDAVRGQFWPRLNVCRLLHVICDCRNGCRPFSSDEVAAKPRKRQPPRSPGSRVPECPPNSGKRLNQKADCASLIQIQTLKQDSFNLNVPHAIAQFDAADMPVHAVGLPSNGERSFVFDASRSIRSFPSSSLPLRI